MDWYKLTVKDLIKELQKFDPEGEVVLKCNIDLNETRFKSDKYADTWDTQNYELDIYNYDYEDDNWAVVESKDIVLDFNIGF